MKLMHLIIVAGLIAATQPPAVAQEAAAGKELITIPREQYQKLLDDQKMLIEQMKEMQAFKARFEAAQKKTAAQQTETDQALDDLDKQVKSVKQMAKDSYPGTSKFLMTGYGSAGFIAQDRGGTKQFNATFNPIFLWKLSDRLLFEGELEAELEGHETSLALEMAQISYLLNDYVTIGAGKFLNPMNYFVERQHMSWVNKLPDKPLAVYDGLLSEAAVGVQIRGAIPAGPTKFGYAFYVANAPELNVDPSTDVGTLEHNNFDNFGNHVAVGGRVGFFPIPELELGYGFQVADVAPPGNGDSVNSLLQSVDLSYVRESPRLKGIINLKAQWVWSHVDQFTYDPDAMPFNNRRDGGYVQLAYRPTRLENAYLKNLEPVFRYDRLSQARTPTEVNEQRYTFGLNYWLSPSSVFKLAYEWDTQSGPSAEPHNAWLMQFVAGF